MSGSTCREIEERLPWYAAGSLPEGEQAEVAAHLELCAACREASVASGTTVAAARSESSESRARLSTPCSTSGPDSRA